MKHCAPSRRRRSAVMGPAGTFGNVLYAGQKQVIANLFTRGARWVYCGDSLGNGYDAAIRRNWGIPTNGLFLNTNSISASDWATPTLTGFGGNFTYGAGTLGLGSTYGLNGSLESLFTTNARATVPVVGGATCLFARITEDDTLSLANRQAAFDGSTDWLAGGTVGNMRVLLYKNPNGSTNFVRYYMRRGADNNNYLGSALLDCHAASNTYAAVDIPFTTVGSDGLANCMQASAEGAAIPNGKNVAQLGVLVTNSGTGITSINLSFGGSGIQSWLDPTYIAAADWPGMLPLLTPNLAIIALVQNGGPYTAADYQALRTTLRANAPGCDILWIATHTTTTNGVPASAEVNTATMLSAVDYTQDAVLNICDYNMSQPQMIAAGFMSDAVHPNSSGYTHLGIVAYELAMAMLGTPVTGNVSVVGANGTHDVTVFFDRATTLLVKPAAGDFQIAGENPTAAVQAAADSITLTFPSVVGTGAAWHMNNGSWVTKTCNTSSGVTSS